MVPNLAHVFFRGGSQGPFREELTRAKMAVLSNLDIWTQTLNSSDALLSAFYATKSVHKVFIYILEIQQHNLQCHAKSQNRKSKGGHFCPPPGQEQSEIARAE